ncbi:MAG TPA: amidohydrolase family protein [Acidimicrobiales bacterium]|nr:amidohydrolase family protein [Acidimicrobiales bacterium]
MDRILFVSADGHTTAPPETFRPYMEARYRSWIDDALQRENENFTRFTGAISNPPPEVLEAIDERRAMRSGGLLGSYDVGRRLAEMDQEGVAAEILIYGTQLATVPFFGVQNGPYPADVRFAGVQAYHRWVADCMAEADGRLFGLADPGPCLDMDGTVEELEWVAAHGFRSIAVPGIISDPALPPLYDPYYEPFWRACAEHGMVLSVHAGHGYPQGHMLGFIERITVGKTQEEIIAAMVSGVEGSPFELDLIPRQVMWSLMLGGVFDRHPGLQLALTEVRADWVPATLDLLDARFEQGGTPLARKPSEYWEQNCWAAVSSIKHSEVRLRAEIGIDRMMFGRDYPHFEGTWPNTWDWIRDTLRDVPEDELRLLLGENAVRCYGLDREKLAAVAERIGPRPSDLLGEHHVDPRVVANLHIRGGGTTSYEQIDRAEVSGLFEEDLAGVTGR